MSSLVKAPWDTSENHFTPNGTWETLKHLELSTIFKLFNVKIFEDRMTFGTRVTILMFKRKRVVIFVAAIWSKQKIVAVVSHLATTRLCSPVVFLVVALEKNIVHRTPSGNVLQYSNYLIPLE